ncbi:DNA alkylation repair protein [Chryseobacterium sp. VAUSW3]|uniref:DNA alkylation repair protein n=1 Tax=Chryseobacterium sp. VAUSW3 TaxID=2010998 RepID=UPI000B4D8D14|nr:DNA alkylation repair protein [Chryseobacterium sp. VAUSW3]OWR15517.1 DNA alkylation repair protein [Chryseobacterium sp. VAUSW3]
MNTVQEIKAALQDLALPEKAAFFPRFFKAGKGEYAEGDKFLGVIVPDQRKVVKEYWNRISLEEIAELLSSTIHEHRHCALLILVNKFEKAKTEKEKKEIVNFYLKHKKFINNWDLVDNSAYKILGRHAYETKDDDLLRTLSREENMWSKRMAIVATMFHVKLGEFSLLKELALYNLQHPHDLMHKANGWLLREMGNENVAELQHFLVKNYKNMPRTTLRYAIEKFDEDLRQDFLKGRI